MRGLRKITDTEALTTLPAGFCFRLTRHSPRGASPVLPSASLSRSTIFQQSLQAVHLQCLNAVEVRNNFVDDIVDSKLRIRKSLAHFDRRRTLPTVIVLPGARHERKDRSCSIACRSSSQVYDRAEWVYIVPFLVSVGI